MGSLGCNRHSRLYARQPAQESDEILQLIRGGLYGGHQRLFFLGDAGQSIEREGVNDALQVLQGEVKGGSVSREAAQRLPIAEVYGDHPVTRCDPQIRLK